MNLTNEELEELERLYAAATQSTWEVEVPAGPCQILAGGSILADLSDEVRDDEEQLLSRNRNDAELIVALRNHFPALLARLREAEKALEDRRVRERWSPKKGDCVRATRNLDLDRIKVYCGSSGVIVKANARGVAVRVQAVNLQPYVIAMDLPSFYNAWEFVLVGESRFARDPLL